MNKRQIAMVMFAAALIAFCTAAGVNGIFNSVTSALGYQVAGAAGSSGQVLSSDGTRYDTALSLYYQNLQEAGSGLTQQPILNFDGTVVGSNGTGKTNVGLPNVGTAGTYVIPGSITTDAQGRVSGITAGTPFGGSGQIIFGNGFEMQFGTASPTTANVAYVQTLSLTFAHACLGVLVSDNGGRVSSGNPSPSAAQCTSTSTITVNSQSTGGGGAEPLQYLAWGW